jgi:hypothetical protein
LVWGILIEILPWTCPLGAAILDAKYCGFCGADFFA